MTGNSPNTNSKAQVILTSLITGEPISFFPYDFDFDDVFRPEWGTYEGFGRMDPVMTYKRTSRTANLSFNVVAEGRNDDALSNNDILSNNGRSTAENNFQKLQKLIKALYPSYKTPSLSFANETLQQRLNTAVQNVSSVLSFNEEIINQGLGIQQLRQEIQSTEQQITNINRNATEQNSLVKTFGIRVIEQSPLFKIRFMNLLNNNEYVIAITNFKHKMKFDAADTSLDRNGKAIPGEFNINMAFTILHTYVPGEQINYNI